MVISGIIRPPPEIRAVADRTASYVAKNGRAFEARILKSEKGKTPKFAFLHNTSPFHAYYEDRIKFYEAGGETEAENISNEKSKNQQEQIEKNSQKESTNAIKPSSSTGRRKEKQQKASAIDPIAKAILEQRAKIADIKAQQENEDRMREEQGDGTTGHTSFRNIVSLPAPWQLDLVNIVAPFNLSPTQLETIQLVAQFAALDGKGGPFLHQLTIREWSNPDFSFCQPRHAHFAYFSALVDGYRKILQDWTNSAEVEEQNKSFDTHAILEHAAYRAEYEREMEHQKAQKQQEEGKVVAIDWHDFVVVETIDFPADERVDVSMLPPPAATRPADVDLSSNNGRPSGTAVGGNAPVRDAMDESSDDDDQQDEGETIRVVSSYTPKVVGASNPSEARVIDPITGKSVPVADMPEHMRIQLLDPKWAEERKKFQEKQKDSNLVSGDAIVANISRLAKSRDGLDKATTFAQGRSLGISVSATGAADDAKRLREAGLNSQETEPPTGPAIKRPRMDLPPAALIPPPPPPVAKTVDQSTTEVSKTDVAAAGITDTEPSFESVNPFLGSSSTQTQERNLLSEQEFLSTLESPEVTLQIRIPNDPTQMAWNFYGQIAAVTVDVMTVVKDVKAMFSKKHLNGMPPNKMLLRDPNGGFLNNNVTLAALNIGPNASLELKTKQRGGRK